MRDEPEPAPLTNLERSQFDAVCSAVTGLGAAAAAGTITTDDVAATMAQAAQVPLDPQRILNAVHVPRDAGDYGDVLAGMLARIPDGWGRWISCGPGWYPLLAELDAGLRAIDPDYVLHQVKEKYGELRCYATRAPMPQPACCAAFDRDHPRPEGDSEPAMTALCALIDEHHASEEHTSQWGDAYAAWRPLAEERADRMEELVAEFEERSATVCETCGQPGEPMVSAGWYMTRCPECRKKQRSE